jgi:hypothetical protein
MTVSKAAYLHGFFDEAIAGGRKVVNSDFTFEIEGFESTWLLVKQAPWPELTPQGEIDIAGPVGQAQWQAQQMKVNRQGSITMMEVTPGTISKTLLGIITQGGYFNARNYEGTPEKFLRYKIFRDCFIQFDDTDRDWENRSQVLTFSGTLFYHYFGDDVVGNSQDYR